MRSFGTSQATGRRSVPRTQAHVLAVLSTTAGDHQAAIAEVAETAPAPPGKPVRIFAYGVNRTRLDEAIRHQKAPAMAVLDVNQADVVMTVKNYYRRKPQPLRDAEAAGIPVYVLRSNTGSQIEEGVTKVAPASSAAVPNAALQEVEDAAHDVLNGTQPAVELTPQNAYIRRLQHQIAERYNLVSRSTGREPFRRVLISRPEE